MPPPELRLAYKLSPSMLVDGILLHTIKVNSAAAAAMAMIFFTLYSLHRCCTGSVCVPISGNCRLSNRTRTSRSAARHGGLNGIKP